MFRTQALALLFSVLLPGLAQACDGRLIEDPAIYNAPLCLPAEPQRVVVLDASFGLGIALDAGLAVVGAPLDLMSDATLKSRAEAAGVTSIGLVTEPSLETIVALQPDLILGFTGSESMASGIYPMAAQLAPTMLYTSLDWAEFYRLLGGLTGQQAEVEDALAAFEVRLADLRDRMPETTVSVLRITSWDFQVYMDSPVTYAPFEIMRRAGVHRSAYETTDDPSLAMKRPDWEELARLDGDILLYIVGGTNASATDGRHEEVLGNPLWQMLPAVQAGRVHRIDPAVWMEFSGLASAHRVLDDLERYVIGQP
ncbi:iron-siderophore ABC transporter substrate-binding protein [Pseudooceanicola aestuarii]|uniref:iron-siderophore ABC transporter substrate-binding protein n=1 Tax=Pseudooceanicola aestuarii TaxID=2697319 RepID=UPI0013D5D5F1|nr:iron-siderophore ABC transporter substrate-binding protein [Pseudooceanicola aestuarii]